MKLVMHSEAPQRVLTGEGFKSCQENRKHVVADGLSDIERFKKVIADSSLNPDAKSPKYTIVRYEETEEGLASFKANKEINERMWRNKALADLDFQVNNLEDKGEDASELRAKRIVLRDYPQQPDFPNGIRPKL